MAQSLLTPDINYNEHEDFFFQTMEKGGREEGVRIFKKTDIKYFMLNYFLYA